LAKLSEIFSGGFFSGGNFHGNFPGVVEIKQ